MTELEFEAGRELVEWFVKHHEFGLSIHQLVGVLEEVKHFTLDYYSHGVRSTEDTLCEWRKRNK